MNEGLAIPSGLRQRWMNLCQRIGLDGSDGWELLRSHYGEAHRAYHNLTHIADCLQRLDTFAGQKEQPKAMELAIWFHDVVYDPHASDNELKSAELAVDFLGEKSLSPQVRELILATRHGKEPLQGDLALISDIDLSILGSEPEVYRRYASAIRSEYAFVPEDQYTAGRSRVLSGFLERPHLFSLPSFRDSLESAARRNLAAEIDALARKQQVRD